MYSSVNGSKFASLNQYFYLVDEGAHLNDSDGKFQPFFVQSPEAVTPICICGGFLKTDNSSDYEERSCSLEDEISSVNPLACLADIEDKEYQAPAHCMFRVFQIAVILSPVIVIDH